MQVFSVGGSVLASMAELCSSHCPPRLAATATKTKEGERLFMMETIQTFFRRLSWTPDGSMLIAPAGSHTKVKKEFCAFVFLRGQYTIPAMCLPTSGRPAVAIRCCPRFFKLCKEHGSPLTDLKYRIVFAVATLEAIFVYDTQHHCPLAKAHGLHLSPLTDIAWFPDGTGLLLSSHDGYVTVIRFEEGELGELLSQVYTCNYRSCSS